MVRRALGWIRLHPIRTAVYALLIGVAISGAFAARGIVRGERDGLLTGVAKSAWVRSFVEHNFNARYSLGSVGFRPDCGARILATFADLELIGITRFGIERLDVCGGTSGSVSGVALGTSMVAIGSARWVLPDAVTVENVVWSDGPDTLLAIRSVEASISGLAGMAREVRIPGIAPMVRSASAALTHAPSSALDFGQVNVSGVEGVVADQKALQTAGLRIRGSAAALADIASAASALLPKWRTTALRLFRNGILIAAALLLVLKLLLTRAPAPWGWRIFAILAPFAAFPLLATTDSWIVIAIAALAIPMVLWAVAYRRASEWHERWEPAAIDIPTLALALPLMLLWTWPEIAIPSLPAINRVSIAQVTAAGVNAIVRQQECGSGDLARISIGQAGASQVEVALDRSTLRSVDIERVFAAGAVDTQAVEAVQPIRFVPAEWKRAPSMKFCVTATVRNGGGAELPSAACPSVAVNAQAAIDLSKLSGRFAADWHGGTQSVKVRGDADAKGARIASITTTGAPLHIARGAGSVQWPDSITAKFDLNGIRAGDASLNALTAKAILPPACTAGPLRIDARAGDLRYRSGGTDIRVMNANFDFARPRRDRVLANATLGGLAVGGSIAANIPTTLLQFEGATSTEAIPSELDGWLRVSAGALKVGSPIVFSAGLWNGDFSLPRQTIDIAQTATARLPGTIPIELTATGSLARVAVRLILADLAPALGPADLHLKNLRLDTSWTREVGLGPVLLGTGWNVVKLGEMPSGVTLDEISNLHITTAGLVTGAPIIHDIRPAFPAVPREVEFRIEGSPKSLTVFPRNGEPILIGGIDSSIKGSFPGLKFDFVEATTSAHVTRAGKTFPVSLRTRLTDTATHAAIAEPLGADISATDEAATFALTLPLETGKFLDQVGIEIPGIATNAKLTSLKGHVTFAGTRVSGLELAGGLAEGALLKGKSFEIAQDTAATFRVNAPALPKAQVSVNAPSLRIDLDGGKLTTSLGVAADAAITLAPAPSSPVLDRLIEAANGLQNHIQKATGVFAGQAGSNYPIGWDVEITGDGKVVSITPDRLAFRGNTMIRRLDVRQQTFDAALNVTAGASVSGDDLALELTVPGTVGAFGRRVSIAAPVVLSLRKELAPGTGELLFDRIYHPAHIDETLRVAVGYGDALQFATSFRTPLLLSSVDALAQAQIKWRPGAAAIDSYGTFSFKGLEAGRLAFPTAALEDRLDGVLDFRTRAFEADRLLLSRLLSDASTVGALDHASFSLKLTSAGGDGALPGITQSSTAFAFTPADRLLRSITQALDLKFPPRAMSYKTLALDFRVKDGIVDTAPVLLTLRGVDTPGVNGLLDSEIRLHWSRLRDEPAPRLRDLIYTVQRAIEP